MSLNKNNQHTRTYLFNNIQMASQVVNLEDKEHAGKDDKDPLQILCYGDSNTWGLEAGTFRRYRFSTRWPGVTASRMGPRYKILEEGLSGRTTVWDDPLCSWLPPNDDPSICNGRKSLLPILHSAKPVVAVVIYLGVNDLKARFHLTPTEVANGVGMLVEKVQQANAGPVAFARDVEDEAGGSNNGGPAILIVCPPVVSNEDFFPDMKGAIEKSFHLVDEYARVAQEKGCQLLDAGTVEGVVCSELDGIHLTEEAHSLLGVAIANSLKEMLEGGNK